MRLLLAIPLTGCLGTGGGNDYDDDDVIGDADTDVDTDVDTDADSDGDDPIAPEIGVGDHTPSSVDLVVIADDGETNYPTGLGFPSDRPGDLWIVNRDDDSWTLVDDVAGDARVRRFYDDSGHFLNAPSSVSFSADETILATCMENANDYNGLQANDYWMGPVVWTADRTRFSGGAFSHYDMAHEESYCMGIAWSEDHVWWAYNGNDRAIDRIDFHDWHPDAPGGLGGEDHTDGEIFRYAENEIESVPDVPSHMRHHPADDKVYFADTGNGRVVRIDATAQSGTRMAGNFSEMAMYRCEADLEVVVAPGELDQPSGLWIHTGDTGTHLYVTDHATGYIHAFTMEGEQVNWLDTGLGGGHVGGIAVSSENAAYFTDMVDDVVYRIDPVVPAE